MNVIIDDDSEGILVALGKSSLQRAAASLNSLSSLNSLNGSFELNLFNPPRRLQSGLLVKSVKSDYGESGIMYW